MGLAEQAKEADDYIMAQSYAQLGPAGRLLKYGCDPKVDQAWVSNLWWDGDYLAMDINVRFRPDFGVITLTHTFNPR